MGEPQLARITTLDPAEVKLNGVDRRLTRIRTICASLWLIPPIVLFIVLSVLLSRWFYIGTAVFAAIYLWSLWLIPRQVRNYAWGITEDAFYIRKGGIFLELQTMPLGRVQSARHSEGPLARHYGLSEVTIESAAGNLEVVGLPVRIARKLTALVVKRAGSDLAGL